MKKIYIRVSSRGFANETCVMAAEDRETADAILSHYNNGEGWAEEIKAKGPMVNAIPAWKDASARCGFDFRV